MKKKVSVILSALVEMVSASRMSDSLYYFKKIISIKKKVGQDLFSCLCRLGVMVELVLLFFSLSYSAVY